MLISIIFLFNITYAQDCIDCDSSSKKKYNIFDQIASYPLKKIKSCLIGLDSSSNLSQLPNSKETALGFRCHEGPPAKYSTHFTPAQLTSGNLIKAEEQIEYVYLSDTEISVAKFPAYYQVVKYSSGAIDIAVLPRNILPLGSGEHFIDDATTLLAGTIHSSSELESFSRANFINGNATKSKNNYITPYLNQLKKDQIPNVTINPVTESSELTKYYVCIEKELISNISQAIKNNFSPYYGTYNFYQDAMNASNWAFKTEHKEKMNELKKKYTKTPEDFIQEAKQKFLANYKDCHDINHGNVNLDEMIKSTLSSFLNNYLQNQKNIQRY